MRLFGCSFLPIPSMSGIFTYIYHINQPNVGKYTIHGFYGLAQLGCLTNSVHLLHYLFLTLRVDSSSDDFMGLFQANGGFCCSFVHVKKPPLFLVGQMKQKKNMLKKNTVFGSFCWKDPNHCFNSPSTKSGKLYSTSSTCMLMFRFSVLVTFLNPFES